MTIVRLFKPLLICAFVLPLFFTSQMVKADDATEGLLKADRAWAADANKIGLKKAIETRAAENMVSLQPGEDPVIGYKAIMKTFEGLENISANWWPVAGDVSADMGYTWGNFKLTITNDDGSKTIETGKYATVWKSIGGEWKVVLDIGTPDPAS